MENCDIRLPAVPLRDIRLVACDMDGTALNSHKQLDRETLDAWEALREAGIACTIASARTPQMLGVFCAQAGISGIPVIALEGALTLSWPDGAPLYDRPMEPESAERVMRYCHEAGLDYTIYTSRRAYLRRDTRRGWRFDQYDALAARYGQAPVARAVYEDSRPRDILDEKVYKIFVDNPDPAQEAALRVFLRGVPQIRTDCSEGHSMVIIHETVSKGAALRALLPHLGLSDEQVCCFGDWYNDLDMLASFPRSVAMGNAVPEAKQAARYVTVTNDEHGVAFFIRRAILSGVSGR